MVSNYSFGGGVRVGWLGTVANGLDLGVSYQTKLYMTDFDDYKGLFAEGGNFDIPAILNAGLAYNLTPKLTLAFDYQRIFYSDVKALNNSNALKPLGNNRLGSDQGKFVLMNNPLIQKNNIVIPVGKPESSCHGGQCSGN